MTRISLFFVSTFAAIVIAIVPRSGPETFSQLPHVKTRSLSEGGVTPAKVRSLVGDVCKVSGKQECKAARGFEGPRG